MKKVIIPPVGGKGSFVSSPGDGARALSCLLLGDPVPLVRILQSAVAANTPAAEWAPAATCWPEFAPSRRSFGRLIKRLGVQTAGRGKAILVNVERLREALEREGASNDVGAAPVAAALNAEDIRLRAALGLPPSKGGR